MIHHQLADTRVSNSHFNREWKKLKKLLKKRGEKRPSRQEFKRFYDDMKVWNAIAEKAMNSIS